MLTMTRTNSPTFGVPTPGAWRQQASCRGVDPEIFYPVSEDEEAAADAKAVCATCPVREPCLEHALTTREKHGVWGGLDERERRRVLRRRRQSA
jgi:WhiB family redox-sensing transcriptional regulator